MCARVARPPRSGSLVLAGWSAGIAFVAGLGGFWLIMLFALAAYVLVMWGEHTTYQRRGRARPPQPRQHTGPDRQREHFLRRAG